MTRVKEGEGPARFGWLCSYTPVEILMAAGCEPVRLDAADIPVPKSNPHIYDLLCPYLRAVFGAGEEGAFGFLEGALFMKCCDGMLRLYDLWRAHLPGQKSYVLPLPKIRTPESIDYFAGVLRSFGDMLGRDMGTPFSKEAVEEAIKAANRLRTVVLRLYQERANNLHSMPYSRLRSLIGEWLSGGPERALQGVEEALKAVKEAPDNSLPSPPEMRVLVTSTTLDQIGILKLIEEAGMTVVGDDHCSGLRHFDELVPEEGDPYVNLANRYLKRWPCVRMQAEPSHLGRLIQEVERVEARGVIYVGLKYCDQPSFELPRLRADLKKRGIPLLHLENDYSAGGLGQMKVRIEAFSEMLSEEL